MIAQITTPVLVATLAATLGWAVFQTIASDGHENRADQLEILLDDAEEAFAASQRENDALSAENAALQSAMTRATAAREAATARARDAETLLLQIKDDPDAMDDIPPALRRLIDDLRCQRGAVADCDGNPPDRGTGAN